MVPEVAAAFVGVVAFIVQAPRGVVGSAGLVTSGYRSPRLAWILSAFGGLLWRDAVAEPERLLIPFEDFEYARFNLIGRYAGNNQFMAFVTGAFPADWWSGDRPPEYLRNRWAEHKRWYAVLHRFGPDGTHLGTEVWNGGTTADGQGEAIERAGKKLNELLESLGPREPCDIRVKPFGVDVDGYLFGLVYQLNNYEDPANPDGTHECVMLEPNDIMFHPPWDSGDYST
jgi:formate hydrogenlyase regulatory protein HycA